MSARQRARTVRAFRSAVVIAVTCIAVGCASAPCIVFITLASALPALLRVSPPAPVARASTRLSNASIPAGAAAVTYDLILAIRSRSACASSPACCTSAAVAYAAWVSV